jgi:deoxyribonuclease V
VRSAAAWLDERAVRMNALHPWRLSLSEALALQRRLAGHVRLVPRDRVVRLVAGADVAYSRRTHRMYAAVVVLRMPELDVADQSTCACRARFPYIPGLFSFRELPPLVRAFERLKTSPDVVLFDGQGLAHPRRFGLACHAGLLIGRATVGCAKSRLVGAHEPVGSQRGDFSPLLLENETVGAVVRTRAGIKPVFVSPGHLMDVSSSVALVLATTTHYRIPEPLRLAHALTAELMRKRDARFRRAVRHGYPDFVAR